MVNYICAATAEEMRQLGCVSPTTANLRGQSYEGDIHHSDMWMLWGEEGMVYVLGEGTITVTVLFHKTLFLPWNNEAQRNDHGPISF